MLLLMTNLNKGLFTINQQAVSQSGLKKENYVSMNEAPNHCALSIWFKVLLKYLELIIYVLLLCAHYVPGTDILRTRVVREITYNFYPSSSPYSVRVTKTSNSSSTVCNRIVWKSLKFRITLRVEFLINKILKIFGNFNVLGI